MTKFNEVIFSSSEIEDVYKAAEAVINNKTKAIVQQKSMTATKFTIDSKTKVQFLKNAWPSVLLVQASKQNNGLTRIEVFVFSKMDSFTQEKTNKDLFDKFMSNLKSFIVEVKEPELSLNNSETVELNNPKSEEINVQPRNNDYDELRELKKLYDEGILTEDEFTEKKRKLMGL